MTAIPTGAAGAQVAPESVESNKDRVFPGTGVPPSVVKLPATVAATPSVSETEVEPLIINIMILVEVTAAAATVTLAAPLLLAAKEASPEN